MRSTYDTASDSISSPDLDASQTSELQSALSAALRRNDPVQSVARILLELANRTPTGRPPVTTDPDGTPVENASG